jgi:RecA-family ATPase
MDAWKTYSDLIEQIDLSTPEEDIIEGIMPENAELVIVAGRAGIGKTWMLTQLAFSLANGKPFLRWNVRPRKPLIVYFEGSPKKLGERLSLMDKHFVSPESFPVAIESNSMPLDTKQGMDKANELMAFCEKNKVKVVFLDPLKFLISKPDHQASVIEVITQLKGLQAKYGVNFVLSAHLRKESNHPDYRLEPDDIRNLKGFTDWGETAQTLLILEKMDKRKKVPHDRCLYIVKGRDIETQDQEAILLTMQNGWFEMVGNE